MADRTPFPVKVLSPEGSLFEGPAQMLIATGSGGSVGLLAKHAPLVADIKMGFIAVQTEAGDWREWAVSDGFAKTDSVEGLALVEQAVALDQIDRTEAQTLVSTGETELAGLPETSDDDAVLSQRRAAEAQVAWGNHLLSAADNGSTIVTSGGGAH